MSEKTLGVLQPNAFGSGSVADNPRSNSAYSVDPSNASFFDKLGNVFTGNLDYARSVALSERAEKVSAYQAQVAREFSAKEARIQREWEEMMSNTAYSRAIKDLKSNGVNPYAIGSFNAASTPTGAYGQSFAGSGYRGSMHNSDTVKSIAQSSLMLLGSVAKLFV